MSEQKSWNRREFVQLVGAATLGSRSAFSSSTSFAHDSNAAFAFVGCAGGKADAIEVFAIRDGRWVPTQSVPSERPVSLALSADKQFLYAVNEISEYNGLPRGTVEAFAIAADGNLTKLNRQALSLSATMPRHLALSPDGKSLIVAARGGGAYNMMPIAQDGSVESASGIFKETGTVAKAAQPHMAIFDDMGRAISIDRGTGRVSVLGTSEDGLAIHAREMTEQDSGPMHIALRPGGRSVYIAHADSLQRYDYDSEAGQIRGLRQQLHGAGVTDGSNALAIHPSGELLFSCHRDGGVTAWRIESESGALRLAGHYAEELGRLHAIDVSGDGRALLAIHHERGFVMGATIDTAAGRLTATRMLAQVDSPKSLAVIYS
jgi:6-phosphogluconolactonase (cycloisomerase 2 family)